MRIAASILVVLGIPWSLIAWIGVGAPLAFFEDILTGQQESVFVLLFGLLFSLQCILGYIIWFRWSSIAIGKSRSSKRFWFIALVHHLVWCSHAFSVDPTFAEGFFTAIFWYSAAVAFACLLAAITHEVGDLRQSEAVPHQNG